MARKRSPLPVQVLLFLLATLLGGRHQQSDQ
jgi:hypothetical protein